MNKNECSCLCAVHGWNDVNTPENPLKYRGFCFVFIKMVTIWSRNYEDWIFKERSLTNELNFSDVLSLTFFVVCK